MSAAELTTLITALATLIAAISGLIYSFRTHKTTAANVIPKIAEIASDTSKIIENTSNASTVQGTTSDTPKASP